MLWHFCFLFIGVVCAQGVPTENEEGATSSGGFDRVGDAADLDQLLGGIDYLDRYCYLTTPFGYGGEPDIVSIQYAIQKMQKSANITETNRLDSGTLFAMRSPRCGMCDTENKDNDITIRGKDTIKYQIFNYPSIKSLITPQQVKKDISTAFALWSQVIPVNFELTDDNNQTDIAISFGKRQHGSLSDPTFDTTGGAFGHVIKGNDDINEGRSWIEMHFDDDEVFTRQERFGHNLFYDAAHQIGHVLGLSHSDIKDAIMWPYAKGFIPGLSLSRDDIDKVQAIQGARAGQEPSPPISVTTAAPVRGAGPRIIEEPEIQNACSDNYAMAIIKGELHVLQGDKVWTYKQSELTEHTVVTSPINGYDIKKYFHGLHNNQDLAYTKADGITVFIRGKNHWLFDGTNLLPDYPKKIKPLYSGIPKNVKAAFHNVHEGITYFFKGDRYWRFSDRKQRIAGTKKGFPISDDFEGLPSDITAAFADSNGYRFLLKGQQVWRYAAGSSKLDPGYPRLFPLPNCQ